MRLHAALMLRKIGHRSGVPLLGQVVLSDNSTAVRAAGPRTWDRSAPRSVESREYWPRSSMTRSRGAHSGGGVAGRPTAAGSSDGSPQALAERNSGVRKVSYGGHGARLVQGLRVRDARYRTILTVGTVPVAALLIRAH